LSSSESLSSLSSSLESLSLSLSLESESESESEEELELELELELEPEEDESESLSSSIGVGEDGTAAWAARPGQDLLGELRTWSTRAEARVLGGAGESGRVAASCAAALGACSARKACTIWNVLRSASSAAADVEIGGTWGIFMCFGFGGPLIYGSGGSVLFRNETFDSSMPLWMLRNRLSGSESGLYMAPQSDGGATL
jgi:hypothetical protein